MSGREILLANLNNIHTTEMGICRIKNNLGLSSEQDSTEFCKSIILNDRCEISRKGKNYYCVLGDITVTVNAHSFTVITAHRK